MKMRSSRHLVSLLVTALILTACGQSHPGTGESGVIPAADYPTPVWQEIPALFPESLKGYELYSWQSGEDWVFTLIAGTNRSKSFEEITSAENKLENGFIKITVTSLDDLEILIKRLPAGVDLTWSGIDLTGQVEEGTQYFTYPPDEMLDRIVDFAAKQGVILHTLKTP